MPENACATCRTNSCFVISVTTITLMEIGTLPNPAMLLLLSRVLFLGVTMAYYYHLGRKPKKIWADFVILPGRGQLSTDYKCGVRRFGLLFDWSSEHYFAHECSLPPSMGPNYCYPSIQQMSTFQTFRQEQLTLWWKWITLEVKPLLTHIPLLCSSECCYYEEGITHW